jgi:hypothetical protein
MYFIEQRRTIARNVQIVTQNHHATEDIEGFSFNTPVSAIMICVNELLAAKCHQ